MRLPVLALLLSLAVVARADDTDGPADASVASPAASPAASGDASGAAASGTPAAPAGSADGVPELPTGTVYLLQEVHLTGSDFMEAILLSDNAVTTLDQCEDARNTGLTTSWPAFHPKLTNYQGLPSRLDYRCVISDQVITTFRYTAPLDFYYLIRIDPDTRTLHMQSYHNYFACRMARGAETRNRFCSRMSQHVVQ